MAGPIERRKSNAEIEERLAAEEGKVTLWKTKPSVQGATNSNISALAFSNLEIGKTYRVSIHARIQGSGIARHRLTVTFGSHLLRVNLQDDHGQGGAASATRIFVADATSSIAGHSRFTGSSNIEYAVTFEELPDHQETSKWD